VKAVTVYLVGAGPGDPGLLTRRGADVLARADVVLHDRLVDPEVLALAPPDAVVLDVGKRPGQRRRQDALNALMIEHARAGRAVVRLKGGDPFLFGRGGEEAAALLAAGVPFEVVPGVSSAMAAPAAAGVPVTHRGLSSSVTVVSGHVGDPGVPGAVDWASLARAGGTLVVMMGMAARAEIARRLIEGGRSPDTPVVVVHRGTTPAQSTVRTTLTDLADVDLGPPCTIVIGAVATLDFRWLTPLPLAGVHVVVTRARHQAGTLRAMLTDAGATVTELPVITIAPPADGGKALRTAAQQASRFDWVVFTSANAVDRFVSLLRDGRDLGGARLAAVGEATARALATHRLAVDLVPEQETAEALAAAMPAGRGGGRVLFPRAAAAREVLAPALRRRGWDVVEVEAYQTLTADASDGVTEALLDAASSADIVTLTSPSTVQGYTKVAGSRRRPPVVACIGPVTAEAARHAGYPVDVVAQDASAEGLVAALCEYVRGMPAPLTSHDTDGRDSDPATRSPRRRQSAISPPT
jgi:uroporphyrinogen III methyltransferase/synthase